MGHQGREGRDVRIDTNLEHLVNIFPHSKDARLPEQLQRAMAAEAEAAREARAKVGILKYVQTLRKIYF